MEENSTQGQEILVVKPHWTGLVTMVSAVATAAGVGYLGFALTGILAGGAAMVAQGAGAVAPFAQQAACVDYADFVLTQAKNGYTAEQIEAVVDQIYARQEQWDGYATTTSTYTYPSSTEPGPARAGDAQPQPPMATSTYTIPPKLGPRIRIDDPKVCGTPAEILEKARSPR